MKFNISTTYISSIFLTVFLCPASMVITSDLGVSPASTTLSDISQESSICFSRPTSPTTPSNFLDHNSSGRMIVVSTVQNSTVSSIVLPTAQNSVVSSIALLTTQNSTETRATSVQSSSATDDHHASTCTQTSTTSVPSSSITEDHHTSACIESWKPWESQPLIDVQELQRFAALSPNIKLAYWCNGAFVRGLDKKIDAKLVQHLCPPLKAQNS